NLIADRTDPVLFALSYDYVGDLSETVALMWPKASPLPPRALARGGEGSGVGGVSASSLPEERADRPPTPDPSPPLAALAGGGGKTPALAEGGEKIAPGHNNPPPPTLAEVVTTLRTLGKTELPKQLSRWLDELDETGRWALLKLVTGAMRIGISARLAKTAAAALGDKDPHDVELMWPGLEPPYLDLFAWLEGRAEAPENLDPTPFRPVMLAHAIEDADFVNLDAADFIAEWKWDGIRVQAVSGHDADGRIQARLYSRSGEDITKSFPDLLPSLHLSGAIDGELLVLREGRVQTFNVLQQRLNRKAVSPKLTKEFPIHLRAYDLLGEGGDDLRMLPFVERRQRLEAFIARLGDGKVDLSPVIEFDGWDALTAARADPAGAGAGEDSEAVEGVMLKRRDALYLPGRPKGQWWKWKRDPHLIDAVLMYAQRGHGKRSSYYSDYTFGVWTSGDDGEQLVPVGKAYFGFTDEELLQIDRFVRRNTTEKFGPVRHVVHAPDQGLVLEVAFEGLARSPRHKSGVAMRFPRINRLRWDKPPHEADRLETLERMLKSEAPGERQSN
ncbi:cisplatin damage response ATP-dependent DNA ligase, partial [Bradyrhizobium sp.]|uniref:cisplatin damage response ATP-dependent DNA ligase n=1 Tax=Bradyrhizobium sp. TaxID=376 RepID=UPI002735AA09